MIMVLMVTKMVKGGAPPLHIKTNNEPTTQSWILSLARLH